MKYQIKCENTLCSRVLRYEDYCEDLRKTPFMGVFCTHCGVEQDITFTQMGGKNALYRAKYHYPSKFRSVQRKDYRACPVCHTFWEDKGINGCPFCMAYSPEVPEIIAVEVPAIANISEDFKNNQARMQLKVDYANSEGRLNLMDFSKSWTEQREFYLELEQQDILNKLSVLEVKEKIKG